MKILHYISVLVGSLLVSAGIIVTPVPVNVPVQPQSQNLGAAITQGGALFDGFLSSGIQAGATSMTLTTGAFNDGTPLSGWNCFTVDANSPSIEYICGNASGTAVSNLMRGVSLVNPNTTSSALAFYHGRGASVQITDYPDLQILKRILNGTDPVPNSLFYAVHPTSTASTTIEDKNYIDTQVISGAPAMSNGQAGIGLQASTTQIASGTNSSGTYPYVLTQANASTSCGAYNVAEANASGTLNAPCLANGNYNLGSTTVQSITSASSTLNGTTTASGTFIFNGVSLASALDKFGGTGASGTLSITGGTTTLNLNNALVSEWNFTSISITSGSLAFSNPNTNGSIIVLKSQGACTFTASTTLINASGMGSSGSTPAFVAGSNTVGTGGGEGGFEAPGGGGGGGASVVNNGSASVGGAGAVPGGSATSSFAYNIARAQFSKVYVQPGAGGGAGNCANDCGAAGGPGGLGGGALYIECGGSLNFGASSTISVAGLKGTVGSDGGSNSGGGGGGGGGGGTAVIVANQISNNFGSINVSGGASSTGGAGSGGGTNGGTGGAGGNGTSTILLNTEF